MTRGAGTARPTLVAVIDRVREAVRTGAGARLALPLNHAAYPRNAAQLKELGAGYTNCADPRNAPVALDAGAMRRLAQASGLRVAEPCGRLDSTVATPYLANLAK